VDLKERWTEDEKQRWTSSWTDCPPSPSGHIYFFELVWPHQVNYQVKPNVPNRNDSLLGRIVLRENTYRY